MLERDLIFRMGVLILLVILTSAGVLLTRFTRLRNPYSSSLAVLYSEILKTFLLLALFFKQRDYSLKQSWEGLKKEILYNPKETIKLILPGILYTIQNNLAYIALSNINAATFQITYQLKILSTSIISVIYLGKNINRSQWAALFLLTVGVIFVQLSSQEFSTALNQSLSNSTQTLEKKFYNLAVTKKGGSWAIGLTCVLCCCLTSSFAGIYYEKLVKVGAQCSVVIRNLQLAIFSLVFGAAAVINQEGVSLIHEYNFFKNFDIYVWLIVILQASAGITVAAVVKYTDNIQKGFAASISIITSSLFSYALLKDLSIDSGFIFGTFVVVASVVLYATGASKNTVNKS